MLRGWRIAARALGGAAFLAMMGAAAVAAAVPTDTEALVIRQVCAGLPAEVGGREDRAVRTEVLVGLVRGTACPSPSAIVDIRGATFPDEIRLTDIDIGPQVLLTRSHFAAAVALRGSRLAKRLSLSGSHFAGDLSLDEIQLGGNLALRKIDARGRVGIDGATIDGNVDLTGARFCGHLAMATVRIRQSLRAWGITWQDPAGCGAAAAAEAEAAAGGAVWDLYDAEIGGRFQLNGADLAHLALLNLTGTRIAGEFFLGSIDHRGVNRWGDATRLVLRNVSAGKIQDVGDASWPRHLDLDGFTYGSWEGLGREATENGEAARIPARGAPWLINWLARDATYNRQSYEQLAEVLKAQGRLDDRNEILFTSRNIERCAAAEPDEETGAIADCVARNRSQEMTEGRSIVRRAWDAVVLTVRWVINGYGYVPGRALFWFLVLIALGTWLFRRTPEGSDKSLRFAAEYTIDTLLPAVSLRPDFDAITITGWVRYYFTLLKVLGYIFVATLLQVFAQLAGRG